MSTRVLCPTAGWLVSRGTREPGAGDPPPFGPSRNPSPRLPGGGAPARDDGRAPPGRR